MRLWSLHPKYLDSKGLVALWREALLAKHVLEGRTKGYRNHPQLNRFKNSGCAVEMINRYLKVVYDESIARNYRFDKDKFKISYDIKISPEMKMSYAIEISSSDIKIPPDTDKAFDKKIPVRSGQMEYEKEHLLKKLKTRDPERYDWMIHIDNVECNPIFEIVDGDVEEWEIVAAE